MSFKANNKQILKNYNKIWKNVEKVMKIDFESKAIYVDDDDDDDDGDDDKYIKTKKNICRQYDYKFSLSKNAQRKSTM